MSGLVDHQRRLSKGLGAIREFLRPAPRVVQIDKAGKPLVAPRNLDYFPRGQTPTDPPLWPFPAYLDNPACAWLQVLKQIYTHPVSFPASISPAGGLLLHSLVRNIQPRVVLETGTCLGVSALWMAGAVIENGHGRLFCFDDDAEIRRAGTGEIVGKGEASLPTRRAFVLDHMQRAGVSDRLELINGDSSHQIQANLDRLREAGGVQLAFLDGDHSEAGVWRDFQAVEPVLSTGGYAVFHDTFPANCGWDGPRKLLNSIHDRAVGTYQVLDLYLSPVNYGLSVVRRIA